MRFRFIKYPPIVNLIIGIVLFVYCMYRILPVWFDSIETDMFFNNASPVQAVCTNSEDLNSFSLTRGTFEYEVNGQTYETQIEGLDLGINVLTLTEGQEIELYVSNSDPTQARYKDAYYNSTVEGARNRHYIKYGLYLIVAIIGILLGVKGLRDKHLEKVRDMEFRKAIIASGKDKDAYAGMYTGNDVPPQPTVNSQFSQPSQQQPYQPSAQPYQQQPYQQQSYQQQPSQQQLYQQPSQQQQPAMPFQQSSMPFGQQGGAQPGKSDSAGNDYTSLDFSHLPPSKPMTVNDQPYEPPKTHEEVPEQPQYEEPEYAEPDYSEPEYQEPEQPEKPSVPSEPVDLNSIIKKGADDPFEMKAEDYDVDPSLAAIIRKGADDPFNMKAEDYQVDPSLAALIRKGSDDPFNSGLKKKDDKKDEEGQE